MAGTAHSGRWYGLAAGTIGDESSDSARNNGGVADVRTAIMTTYLAIARGLALRLGLAVVVAMLIEVVLPAIIAAQRTGL